jgi:integrase
MNIYGHVLPAIQQQAAGYIDAALSDRTEGVATGDD